MSQTTEPPILRRRKNHLPEDIVLSILTRLPPKTVIRFRCVCKSWDSSITTPYFISTHLNNFAHDNDNGGGYLIHMPRRTNSSNKAVCTVALDLTFDRISEIEVPFDFPSGSVQIAGSCNGLLCLAYNGFFNIFGNVIYLWNPSIRKFKRLPDPYLERLGCYGLRFGFVYDSENNDYKVVKISSYLPKGLPPPMPDEIEVYTLSSDSWRRVGMSLRTNVKVFDDNFQIPLVSGALHWISLVLEGEEEHKGEVIMSFNVNSEKFRMFVMPDGSLSTSRSQRSLALFKGKLAFITFGITDQHGYHYSMWVMREYGVLESWNQLFVVPLARISDCIGFTMCGSLLIHYVESNNQAEKFVLVDTKTLHEKDLDIQQPSRVATFMESLALLDGANMVSY
ncbi:F-box/kelch-repeat protein At3g06240-like [Quercus lobata]|uniref:F-box domain-containing protein n=1 Tax=Quercus lobata TaxID=97700 RepID=A0A7N2LGR1_QUELO|nr:F-box/kelch-repeat protein At3g06240-like [Quercus lobata]